MHRRHFVFLGSAAAGLTFLSTAARATGIVRAETRPQSAIPCPKDEVQPFTISVPRAQLVDLQERLAKTRWPDKETVDNTPLNDVRSLVERWKNGYDWRACEKLLNGLGQQVTHIDGFDIQFLHIRSKEPNAPPLLLTHD